MTHKNYKIDLLRTLVLAAEGGSFTDVARRVGRSQSAVSLRLKKLEDEAGVPILRRSGQRTELTEAGHVMLSYATRILALNDDLSDMLGGLDIEGSIRIGLPADLAEGWLSSALASFVRTHPKIHVQVSVARNVELVEQTARGELDVSLAFSQADSGGETVCRLPVFWIGRRDEPRRFLEEVPLVLFDAPCMFRQLGVETLERENRRWHVVITSPSLAGLSSAIEGGIGIGIRTALGLPKGLGPIEGAGLPRLDRSVRLALHTAEQEPSAAVRAFRAIAFDTLASMKI